MVPGTTRPGWSHWALGQAELIHPHREDPSVLHGGGQSPPDSPEVVRRYVRGHCASQHAWEVLFQGAEEMKKIFFANRRTWVKAKGGRENAVIQWP